MRAQLLAITSSDDSGGTGHRAIFYDQDKDLLVTVIAGDSIVGRRVTLVDAEGVTLTQGSGAQRLDLRPVRDRRPPGASAAQDLAALMGRPSSTPRPGTNSPLSPVGTRPVGTRVNP